MPVCITTLFTSDDGSNDMFGSPPDVFAGVSSMDCVNQIKQFMVSNFDLGQNGEEQESRDSFNSAGTFKELKAWFREHYCSFSIQENWFDVKEAGTSPAVTMPAER